MEITVTNIQSVPEYITIKRSEYIELKSKARRYDERRAKEQDHIKVLNYSRTKAERKLLAQKAAQARWSKKEVK